MAGIVVSPEPDHLFRKLSRTLARAMGSDAEAEVRVVRLELERIGHSDVGEEASFRNEGSPGRLSHPVSRHEYCGDPRAKLFGIVLSAIGHGGVFMPLNGSKTSDQEITRLNSSGICQAALNEVMPPDDNPVIAWL